MSSNKKTA